MLETEDCTLTPAPTQDVPRKKVTFTCSSGNMEGEGQETMENLSAQIHLGGEGDTHNKKCLPSIALCSELAGEGNQGQVLCL